MNKTEKLKTIFQNNKIVKTCDIKKLNFSNVEIAKLCNDGIITRIKHGYYSLGNEFVSDEQVISTLLPDVILCLETALFITAIVIMHRECGMLLCLVHFQGQN